MVVRSTGSPFSSTIPQTITHRHERVVLSCLCQLLLQGPICHGLLVLRKLLVLKEEASYIRHLQMLPGHHLLRSSHNHLSPPLTAPNHIKTLRTYLKYSNKSPSQKNPARASKLPQHLPAKMHAQNIFVFLALAVMAMSAAIPAAVPAPGAGTCSWFAWDLSSQMANVPAEIVRKSEDSADKVDITQIGDGY